ncbi:MAG: hypothetical protein IPH04_14415 [Saprospirales bacterium]|nr:hypothetical protein [Saprospirales bacterium]
MNDDDSVAVIPPGDYRYARNIRITHSRTGDVARIKNIPGTSEVEYALQGTGTVQVVGSLEDEQHDRVFYFVSATTGYQEILCYFRREGVIRRVMWDYFINDLDGVDGSLDFSADSLITGVGLLHPFLFWTDNNNHPRFINVDRALRTFDVSYVDDNGDSPDPYLFPLYYKDLTIIRPLPIFPPVLEKLVSTDQATVADQQSNQIKNYAFQFCYRFMYRDGLYSALSPQSMLENYNNLDNSELYDTIRVWIPKTQKIAKEVRRVEAIHRVPGTNNYYVVKSWDRDNPDDEILMNGHNSLSNANPQLYFDWFNTYTGTPIAEAEALKLFDAVPVQSKALEVADNRVFLGNNTEGYDLPEDRSMDFSASAINQANGAGLTAEYWMVYVDCSTAGLGPTYALLVLIPGDGYYFVANTANAYYHFFADSLPTVQYLSSADRVGDASMTEADLIAEYSPCDTPDVNSFAQGGYNGTQPTIFGLTDEAPFAEGVRIFKSNSRYRVGIVFFDFAGRNSGVITTEECLVSTANRAAFEEEFTTGIAWEIDEGSDAIPEWATHYAIVRTKNLTTTFFTQFINDAPTPFATNALATKYVLRDEDGALTYQTAWETEVYAIAYGIDNLAGLGHGYTFSDGDFLRVYANDNSSFKDFRIIGQEGAYLLVEPKNLGTLNAANIYYQSVVEIYTPHIESADELFYEVGNMYAVTSPGTNDRDFSVLTGVLRGDSYIKQRHVPEDNSTLLFESMSPADSFWNVWNTDAGRPNVVIKDAAQQIRRTALRWSNQYIAGSRVNGLCSYDAADERVLDERIGDIQKLVLAGKGQSEGSILLVIGKNNTASFTWAKPKWLTIPRRHSWLPPVRW